MSLLGQERSFNRSAGIDFRSDSATAVRSCIGLGFWDTELTIGCSVYVKLVPAAYRQGRRCTSRANKVAFPRHFFEPAYQVTIFHKSCGNPG